MSGFDEQIEAVRADPFDVALKFNADLRCGMTGTQVQNLAGLIAKERDALTKANEELRAEVERLQTTIKAFNNGMPAMTTKEVADENADLRATIDRLTKERDEAQEGQELAKEEGISETLALLDRLTGGDGEYFASTRPGRGCHDEAAMQAKIVARFDALTKERDEAVRAAGVVDRELDRLHTRLSAMQEAIAEAVRTLRISQGRLALTGILEGVRDAISLLKPFATKPEPEVDPLVGEVTVSILNRGERVVSLPELARLINGGARITALATRNHTEGRTALAARGLEVRKVGEASVPVTKATHTCKHEGDNCQRHNLHCAWPECAVVRNHTEGRTDG